MTKKLKEQIREERIKASRQTADLLWEAMGFVENIAMLPLKRDPELRRRVREVWLSSPP